MVNTDDNEDDVVVSTDLATETEKRMALDCFSGSTFLTSIYLPQAERRLWPLLVEYCIVS